MALDAGADDYIAKPLNPEELLIRVRLALRHRLPVGSKAVVACGSLAIDLIERRVSMNGKILHLSPNEYKILGALAEQSGRVVSCQHLLRLIRRTVTQRGKNYIRQYIAIIRRKLSSETACCIINVRGVGYQLLLQSQPGETGGNLDKGNSIKA